MNTNRREYKSQIAKSQFPTVTDLFELTKPQLVLMVLITTCSGFYLALPPNIAYFSFHLIHTLIGTGLAAGGSLALNQFLERDLDPLMRRTCSRPLPENRVTPRTALIFGTLITIIGLVYLIFLVNWQSSAVVSSIVLIYLFIYTPLKLKSPISTFFGAIPGALPPVVGWIAVTGKFDLEAWILFGILFLWQMPHSLSISWLYRDDYAKAGFRILPIADPSGNRTIITILINAFLLIPISILPKLIGLADWLYFGTALIASSVFFGFGISLAISRTNATAKHLLFASLIYLPTIFVAMSIDKI